MELPFCHLYVRTHRSMQHLPSMNQLSWADLGIESWLWWQISTSFQVNQVHSVYLRIKWHQWLLILVSPTVIRHLLRRQLLLRWYLRHKRVRVKEMIGFLVRGKVRIKIRVRVGVTFNVRVYRWSNCRRSKCRTFVSYTSFRGVQYG